MKKAPTEPTSATDRMVGTNSRTSTAGRSNQRAALAVIPTIAKATAHRPSIGHQWFTIHTNGAVPAQDGKEAPFDFAGPFPYIVRVTSRVGKWRSKRRLRSSKRLRVFMLTLGLATLVLGILLLGFHVLWGRQGIARIGICYVVAGVAVLGCRTVILAVDRRRKRKYRRR